MVRVPSTAQEPPYPISKSGLSRPTLIKFGGDPEMLGLRCRPFYDTFQIVLSSDAPLLAEHDFTFQKFYALSQEVDRNACAYRVQDQSNLKIELFPDQRAK